MFDGNLMAYWDFPDGLPGLRTLIKKFVRIT
jgi:hypothetical protein